MRPGRKRKEAEEEEEAFSSPPLSFSGGRPELILY